MGIADRLHESFSMYDDLVAQLPEADLRRDLPVPSNTIWDQLWCVVGGRESYVAAVEAGEWVGFRCSLGAETRGYSDPLAAALRSSAAAVDGVIARDAGPGSLDLLMHEAQHQGQLIRYLLGLQLDVPESWARKWSL